METIYCTLNAKRLTFRGAAGRKAGDCPSETGQKRSACNQALLFWIPAAKTAGTVRNGNIRNRAYIS